ncbi:MAG TPA: polyprenyl synthetase family protein [Gemmatimonadales bacterium]
MPDQDLVEALLAEARQATEAVLARWGARLRAEVAPPLGEALAYALGTRGKRVRPALVMASYRAAGGTDPGIVGIGAAVEVVHTYSLVHDDLPCMDNDAQRRGRPTTHVRYDVPTATNVGWVLVPVAVEVLVEAASMLGRGPEATAAMASVMLEAGGIRGMIGGQWLDLAAETRTLTVEQLTEVHRGKTGALIEACCRLGGMAAEADARRLDALSAYGRDIGLAFQIADDVLDATATSAQLGKTAGRDAVLAKSTFVSLLGVEGAQREAQRHAELAVSSLADAGLASETLEALAGYIIHRSS